MFSLSSLQEQWDKTVEKTGVKQAMNNVKDAFEPGPKQRREVHVLIENLTEQRLELSGTFTEKDCQEVIPPCLERASRIVWFSEGGVVAGSAEFNIAGGEPGTRTRFCLAANLPAHSPMQAQMAKAFAGLADSTGASSLGAGPTPPRFGARLLAVSKREPQRETRLKEALRTAPGIPKPGEVFVNDDLCEWSVVRKDDHVLKLRVRIVPPDPRAAAEFAEEPPDEAEEQALLSLTRPDQELLDQLHAYREKTRRSTEEARHSSEELADSQAGFDKITGLSERSQADMGFALLTVLLRRRRAAMVYSFTPSNKQVSRQKSSKEKAPLDVAADMARRAWHWDFQDEPKMEFSAALATHVEIVYRALIPLLGIADPRVEEKTANLIVEYLPKADNETPPDPPDPDFVCSALRRSLGVEDAAQAEDSMAAAASAAPATPSAVAAAASSSSGEAPAVAAASSSSSGVELQDPSASSAPARGTTEAWRVMRQLLMLILGHTGCFDARTRIVLHDLAYRLGVPIKLMLVWEAEIGGMLFDALEAKHIVDNQKDTGKLKRRGKVAVAAVAGGTLLAITGGLAAPAVAAGVAGLGGMAAATGASVGGVAAGAGAAAGGALTAGAFYFAALGSVGAGALFGATGAGLTGWKLSKRWGALDEFEFETLKSHSRQVTLVVEIPGEDADTVQGLDGYLGEHDGEVPEDIVAPGPPHRQVAIPKGSRLFARECVRIPPGREGEGQPLVRYIFTREREQALQAVHVAVFVSGWIKDEGECDFKAPWQEASELFFPTSAHLALKWEPAILREMSSIFTRMLKEQAASQAVQYGAKIVAASAAAVIAWPIWIIGALSGLDNAWLVCADRAKLAGKCLALALVDRKQVGQRPITLIGHSMGARLIFYCLLELHTMGEFHAVDDVILLGTPVTTAVSSWKMARSVVSGRLVNGYLAHDWLLAFLYRYLEWGISVAGLSEVGVPGVENVDLEGLGIKSHEDYPNHMLDILSRVRAGERSPNLGLV